MLRPMGLLRKIGPIARVGMFWRVLTNKSTPWWAKAGFLATGTGYFVFSGGWIPFAGWLDDLIVLPVLAWFWGQLLPRIFGWPVWNVFRREGKSL